MKHISFATPREMVAFDGERCTPWVETQILSAHMHRYLSTLALCQGKRVLDIASGEGYGAAMLVRNGAAAVSGVDIDGDAVARANRVYAHGNLQFKAADIRAPLPFDNDSFDVVVSFETIEHIAEHQAFLDEIARVLTPDGVLIISTPDAAKSDPNTPNPFHEKELTKGDFLELIGASFAHVTTCYQGYHFGSVITQDGANDAQPQHWNRQGFLGYAQGGEDNLYRYIIAVASNVAPTRIPAGLLNDGSIIASLNKRIRLLEAELLEARSEIETNNDQS